MPIAGRARETFTPSSNAGPFASSEVLVTIPPRCASAMPRFTPVVHPYGCMIVLPESFSLEHRVALTNLATGSSNAAVVVWKGNPRPEGWEYGIELVAPDLDFWGLEL